MKTVIKTFITTMTLVVILILLVIFSGAFNVSTQWEDPSVLRWLLVSTREASVKKYAANITPPELAGAENIKNGFRSYREMCSVCHTSPGVSDSPIAQGLNPSPPNLTMAQDHPMTDAELFWVIKNGIRMTGMPAWGPTHGDAEIWDIVAFVKALPTIDAAEYQNLDKNSLPGHGHSGAESENKNHHGMGASTGHDSGEVSSHDEIIDEAAPIGHIDNGGHAH